MISAKIKQTGKQCCAVIQVLRQQEQWSSGYQETDSKCLCLQCKRSSGCFDKTQYKILQFLYRLDSRNYCEGGFERDKYTTEKVFLGIPAEKPLGR